VLVRIVLWGLADSKTSIAELRTRLETGSLDGSAEAPGLRFKAWISHEPSERWGAIELWESREAAEQADATSVRELIGKEPDLGDEFDVEATVEGRFADGRLAGRGLAFGD
jgi:hypothetical protein